MKRNFSKALVLLLALALLATQIMVPAFAVETEFACTCDEEGRTGVKVESFDPTCTEYGYDVYVCDECDGIYNVLTAVPTPHNLESVNPQAPTCTEIGWEAYEYCMDCDYTTYKEIKATGHNYVDIPAAKPDCQTNAIIKSVCTNCGDTTTRPGPEGPDHNWVEIDRIEADICTEEGTIVLQCTNCKRTKTEAIPAGKHDYVITVEGATCDTAEVATYTCTICGYSEIKKITAGELGHDQKTVKGYAATCTEEGLTDGIVCQRCDKVIKAQTVIPALKHDYKKTVTAPTCVSEGYTTYTCSRCNDSYKGDYVAIDPLSHTPYESKPAVDPTCVATGLTRELTCGGCGLLLAKQKELPINPENHAYKVVSKKDATCTEDGYVEHEECTLCGAKSGYKVIPALRHNYKGVVTKPTCTEQGYTTYTCTRCKDSYKGNYVAALGHDFDVKVTDPTCETEGYTIKTCKRDGCGHSEKVDVLPALNHDTRITLGEVAPTCTEKGETIYKCLRCEKIFSEEIDALGHDYIDVPELAPTCTETGHVAHQLCQRCFFINGYDRIPATGHNYTEIVTAPTCTEGGYSWFKCINCRHSYEGNYVDALGHTEIVIPGTPATFDEKGLSDGKKCEVCDVVTYPQKEIPVLDEEISFTYEVTGINGSAQTTNSGYITFNIYMNVNTAQARLWGVDLAIKYNTALSLQKVDGCIFEQTLFTPAYIADELGVVYVTENNGFTPDELTFAEGKYLFATLTFRVDNDFYYEDLYFDVLVDECGTVRDEHANELFVDYGYGAEIHVNMLGDANEDGKITSADVFAYSKWVAGADLEDYEVIFDLNKDGFIDGDDFALLGAAVVKDNSYLEY